MNNAPDVPAEGAANHSQPINPGEDIQPTLEDYRDDLLAAATDAGLDLARRSDPDRYDAAQTAVLQAIPRGCEGSSDDVPEYLHGPQLGAAFRALSKAGELEHVGFVTSLRPKSHGRYVMLWRRCGGPS
jgi:hypothetical protein